MKQTGLKACFPEISSDTMCEIVFNLRAVWMDSWYQS